MISSKFGGRCRTTNPPPPPPPIKKPKIINNLNKNAMNSESFTFWLQGYVELNGETPTPAQWELIKEHLALVFNKQTSSLQDLIGKTNKDAKEFNFPETYCKLTGLPNFNTVIQSC